MGEIATQDVLAQPTRRRLYELIGELRRPASTAELAVALSLHPNGVRTHLERMERAGVVVRTRRRRPRGRPTDDWTLVAGAAPQGSAPQGYRDLGRWLARAMRAPEPGLAGVERTGREIGRELGDENSQPGLEGLRGTLSALGFEPAVTDRGPGDSTATICLRNCPYRDAVHENQPAVCALHKGITEGLLDRLHPAARLGAFVAKHPDRAGCTIELKPADA